MGQMLTAMPTGMSSTIDQGNRMIRDRASALVLAEKMVKAAPTYIQYQVGYAEGLLAGWQQAGWISKAEMTKFRDLIQTAKPAWRNLIARFGF